MRKALLCLVGIGTAVIAMGGLLFAEMGVETDPLGPKCPPDRIEAAKKNTNPIPVTEDIIDEGQELYEGKGLCITCHGEEGRGDGDAGKALDPGPRDFTSPAFWKAKTEGEMQCTQEAGISGTGMISYVPAIITEEEGWKIIIYDRTFNTEYEGYNPRD